SALARRSARSMSPSFKQATDTTLNPAMTALAGFVPCADVGMRHTLRCASPREAWYSRIASKPANSPCDPALGCSDTAAKPVISASHSSSCLQISMYPTVCSPGANGCNLETSGHEIGNIAAVAVDFIVHEPSGIIDVVSERSRDSSFFDVPQHFCLGVVCVEGRMAENLRSANGELRNTQRWLA